MKIEILFIFGLPKWKLKHAQRQNHDIVCVAIVFEKRDKYFSIYLDSPLSFKVKDLALMCLNFNWLLLKIRVRCNQEGIIKALDIATHGIAFVGKLRKMNNLIHTALCQGMSLVMSEVFVVM